MKVSTTPSPRLAAFAKVVVAMTFCLIFVGGHTTTSGAGMAFPDWPLSNGSLNPHGWWTDVFQRLEHGHRLIAETVGLAVGVLCAWVWGSKWAFPAALTGSLILAGIGKLAGVSNPVVAHLGFWGAAAIFCACLFLRLGITRGARLDRARWFALAAFLGVCVQAVLGGLRVTIESGGNADTAVLFRVIHGCFAQLELCLLVVVAALLSRVSERCVWQPSFRTISVFSWVAAGCVYLQLIVGASMRHLNAGLAIPTFPQASPDGALFPQDPVIFAVVLNFLHTRVGALFVSAVVLALIYFVFSRAKGALFLFKPALLLGFLVLLQVLLGMFVIWGNRPLLLTTAHVLNGAALLSVVVLIGVRSTRGLGCATAELEDNASAKVMEEPL